MDARPRNPVFLEIVEVLIFCMEIFLNSVFKRGK